MYVYIVKVSPEKYTTLTYTLIIKKKHSIPQTVTFNFI